jgi:hypothetical protein
MDDLEDAVLEPGGHAVLVDSVGEHDAPRNAP